MLQVKFIHIHYNYMCHVYGLWRQGPLSPFWLKHSISPIFDSLPPPENGIVLMQAIGLAGGCTQRKREPLPTD